MIFKLEKGKEGEVFKELPRSIMTCSEAGFI